MHCASQRLQLGQISGVRYLCTPPPSTANSTRFPFISKSSVDIPKAGDQNVSECKKVIKRCSSGRPLWLTRVETEVFILCYDSKHPLPASITVPCEWSRGTDVSPTSCVNQNLECTSTDMECPSWTVRSSSGKAKRNEHRSDSLTSFCSVPRLWKSGTWSQDT